MNSDISNNLVFLRFLCLFEPSKIRNPHIQESDIKRSAGKSESDSRQEEWIFLSSHWHWIPPSFVQSKLGARFSGAKRPGREVGYTSPSIAKVNMSGAIPPLPHT
jgi:hypothetical protein